MAREKVEAWMEDAYCSGGQIEKCSSEGVCGIATMYALDPSKCKFLGPNERDQWVEVGKCEGKSPDQCSIEGLKAMARSRWLAPSESASMTRDETKHWLHNIFKLLGPVKG